MAPKLFSERMGHEPLRPALQVEDIDAPLRNRLLNCLLELVPLAEVGSGFIPEPSHSAIMRVLWDGFFKRPLRELDAAHVVEAGQFVAKVFESAPWHQVYSLLEFVRFCLRPHQQPQFERMFNAVLAQELAGYRFVNGCMTPVTNQTEIESLEEGLEASHPPAREHLGKALALFAEREGRTTRRSFRNQCPPSRLSFRN